MALPKGKLLALVAVFAAIGIAAGTGAFTTVTAERTATVGVSGDAGALLALEPADTKNGDVYASTGNDDQLQIELANDNQGSTGINPNATTAAHDVITITNQGSQTVHVTLVRNGNNSKAVTFAVDNSSLGTSGLTTVGITGANNAVPITADNGGTTVAYELDPGENVDVGLYADTTDQNPLNGAYVSTSNSALGNTTNLLTDVTVIAANDTSTISDETGNSVTEVSN